MYHLTEKENLMRMLNGELPEYLPRYDFMWYTGIPMFSKPDKDGVVTDAFGMRHITSKESMGGYMPMPGQIFLEDITKWRDVVKTPDESDRDWEAMARDALKDRDWEHNPVVAMNGDYFVTLMNMMGFVGGLCAMVEEPEEVYALFDYLSAFYLRREEALIKYFHLDVYSIADDTAAMRAPFIDVETYRRLVKPFHKREAEMALNAGVKVQMHDCGKCESFIDDWLDIGVSAWDPAQVSNDLDGIKKKYGRRLVIVGGWDNQGPISYPTTPDEELAEALRAYIDRFAPDGGFCYRPGVVGSRGEEIFDRKMKLTKTVYDEYGRDWYKNHGY